MRRAVILAGGRGRRLVPYTFVIPKPIVPIGTTPILEIVLRQLAREGVIVLVGAAAPVPAVTAPVTVHRIDDLDEGPTLREALGARPDELWLPRPDAHVATVVTTARELNTALGRLLAHEERHSWQYVVFLGRAWRRLERRYVIALLVTGFVGASVPVLWWGPNTLLYNTTKVKRTMSLVSSVSGSTETMVPRPNCACRTCSPGFRPNDTD